MWCAWRIATAASDLARAVVGVAVLAFLVGCSSSRQPEALPPQTLSQSAAAPAPVPPPSEPPVSAPLPQTEPIVIDPGQVSSTTRADSLVEAAEAERRRRETSTGPAFVITDDNLKKHATGDLTVAAGGVDEVDEDRAEEPSSGSEAQGEAYWRSALREARLSWRDAWERLGDQTELAASLRRRFYAEDDPWVRDTRIKPELDRVTAALGDLRARIDEARLAVTDLLEQGRRAGALPGWLREGVEFEPPAEEGEPAGEPVQGAEPREPSIVDETGGEGR